MSLGLRRFFKDGRRSPDWCIPGNIVCVAGHLIIFKTTHLSFFYRLWSAYHYAIEFHTGPGFLNDLNGAVTVELTGSKKTESVDLTK